MVQLLRLLLIVLCVCVPVVGQARIARLALVPMDTRPVCLRHPVQIGAAAGVSVSVPPEGNLGGLTQPGDCDGAIAWLEQQAPLVDGAVVAIGMIATGGLVASRTPAMDADAAIERLGRLHEVRALLPESGPLFAFDTIQRIAPTAFDRESGAVAGAIAEYARIADQARRERTPALIARADELRAAIPPEALEAYLAARARNLRVNLAAVDLVAEGVIDHLVLAQDDTAPYGPHVVELAEIRARVAQLGVADRVSIHPGADEVAMTLVARAALRHVAPLRIKVEYFPPGSADEIQPYEDRPLRESMVSQIEALACRQVGLVHDADIVLVILARATEGMSEEEHAAAIRAAAERIATLVDGGAAVAVADTARVNIAEPALIGLLQEAGIIPRLCAYSGWGTPANTIGTALAHAAAEAVGQGLRGAKRAGAKLAGRRFLFERLADDYVYLTQVRPEVAEAQGVSGYSSHLEAAASEVSAAVALRMQDCAPELFEGAYAEATIDLYGSPRSLRLHRLRAWLPWPRMFEVAVEADVVTGGRP